MQKLPDAASLTPEQLVERWTLWLKETQQEAFHLYSFRFRFENVSAMFASNQSLQEQGGFVHDWLTRIYVAEHLISIRRELEKGGGFLTLVNFLIELEQYSESVLMRTRYVALYPESLAKKHGLADKNFDAMPGCICRYPRTDPTEDCLSAHSIRARREQLQKDTEKVVRYANWFIAHRTRQKPIKLTIADMHRAVNRIFDTYALYYSVIVGSTWMSRYPTPQYNWRAPFEMAWITDTFTEWEPPHEPDVL